MAATRTTYSLVYVQWETKFASSLVIELRARAPYKLYQPKPLSHLLGQWNTRCLLVKLAWATWLPWPNTLADGIELC